MVSSLPQTEQLSRQHMITFVEIIFWSEVINSCALPRRASYCYVSPFRLFAPGPDVSPRTHCQPMRAGAIGNPPRCELRRFGISVKRQKFLSQNLSFKLARKRRRLSQAWRNTPISSPSLMATDTYPEPDATRSAFFPESAVADLASPSETSSNAASSMQRSLKHTLSDKPAGLRHKRVSASPPVLHRATHSQSSSAVRAWRFPSSRKFLWDRTAVGPGINLHPQVLKALQTHDAGLVLACPSCAVASQQLHRCSCLVSL